MLGKKKKSKDYSKDNLKIAKEAFDSDKYCAVIMDFETANCAIIGHKVSEQAIIDVLAGAIKKVNNK